MEERREGRMEEWREGFFSVALVVSYTSSSNALPPERQ